MSVAINLQEPIGSELRQPGAERNAHLLYDLRSSCACTHRRVLGLADLMFEAPHAHMEIYSIAGLLRQWPDVLLLIV